MKKVFILIAFLIFMGFNLGCNPEGTENSKYRENQVVKRLDSLISSHYQNDIFHGGIVVSQKGEILYENYLGIADRTWQIAVDEEVKFDIASVNKSMIAALIMKAVEEGKLSLDDKLIDLLSDYSYEGKFHPEITLHHMLSHSSGLPDYDGVDASLKKDQFLEFKRLRFSNDEYVNFISKLQPVNIPGEQFYYSNFAYHLLSIILENVYANTFEELLKKKLAEPLGLKNTVSSSRNEIVIPKLATAYNYQDGGEWHQNNFIDLTLGRRIFSTASDLNRWAQVMDNPGWLSEKSLTLIQTNHQAKVDPDFSYGYGWVIIDKDNKSRMVDLGIDLPYIIHGGSTEGYKSMLINIDGGTYVISFLSNVGQKTDEIALAREIVHILIK